MPNVLLTDAPLGELFELLCSNVPSLAVRVGPNSGGGGTLLPLNVAFVYGASSAPGTPDGSIQNPFTDVQDAVDAGFVNVLCAPGSYTDVVMATPGADFYIGALAGGPKIGAVSLGNITMTSLASLTLQNMFAQQVNGSATPGGTSSVLQLIDVALGGDIVGNGPADFTVRTGTTLQVNTPGQPPNLLQNILAAGEVSLAWTSLAGDISCSEIHAAYSQGVGIAGSDFGEFDHCAFSGDVIFGGTGQSIARSSVIIGATLVDTINAFDSRFLSQISGNPAGIGLFWNCILNSAGNPITCDGATEMASLKTGFVTAGDRIVALDQGQNGDALVISGSTTVNLTAQTRVLVPPDFPAGQTLVLDETGGASPQQITVDMWGPNSVTVHDSAAASIGPLDPQTPGNGVRYTFQVDAGSGKFVKFFVDKLTGT